MNQIQDTTRLKEEGCETRTKNDRGYRVDENDHMAIKHGVFRKRGMISLELSLLLLALLRVSAIWKTGAAVELARRVGAGMPQSQGFSAIRALRWQFHATEDVRADPVMQLVYEPRRS